MIRKVLLAASILIKSPSGFVRLLRDRIHRVQTLHHLRRVRVQSGQKIVFAASGQLKLPFHDDGDMQELLYHMHGRVWYDVEMAILNQHVKPGDTVIDVGANMGFISGIASKLVGQNGQVHSFEPSPIVYGKLMGVIRENAFANITPYNLGCGDVPGEMMLASPTESSGNATLTSPESATGARQRVQIVRLDDFFAESLERLDFIKIDTEGFEDHVLVGATRLIDAYQPTIYIELAAEYRDSSQRSIQWLRDHGYVFEVEPDLSSAHNGDNFIASHSSKVQASSKI